VPRLGRDLRPCAPTKTESAAINPTWPQPSAPPAAARPETIGDRSSFLDALRGCGRPRTPKVRNNITPSATKHLSLLLLRHFTCAQRDGREQSARGFRQSRRFPRRRTTRAAGPVPPPGLPQCSRHRDPPGYGVPGESPRRNGISSMRRTHFAKRSRRRGEAVTTPNLSVGLSGPSCANVFPCHAPSCRPSSLCEQRRWHHQLPQDCPF